MSPKKFKKEKVIKDDGRYVIFYRFEEESRDQSRELRDLRPETREPSTEHGARSPEVREER